jgi:hypothetical protein
MFESHVIDAAWFCGPNRNSGLREIRAMPAENAAIDPWRIKARKFRILAEEARGSRLDYLVLAAAYEALIDAEAKLSTVKEPTIDDLAA